MGLGGRDGVGVHPHDLHLGVTGLELLLELLGPHADHPEPPIALGAQVGQGLGMAAVVTHEPPVGAVVGQVDRAPGTGRDLPAVAAGHHPAVAPAVEKEDALLSPPEVLFQFLQEELGQTGVIPLPKLRLHVHDVDRGHGLGIVALLQGKQVILAGLGGVSAVHTRSCRSQQEKAPMLGTAEFCHLPGMVTDHALGLVAPLLLLVQDNKARVGQRGKNSGPGADDHGGQALPDTLPFVVTLAHRQAAVEDGYLPAKMGNKDLEQAGGQGDLRHHDDGPSALVQNLLDQVEVDLGLAAAGDPVEQGRLGLSRVHQLGQAFTGPLLLGIQGVQGGDFPGPGQFPPKDLLLLQGEDAAPGQGLHRLLGGPRKVAQLLHAGAAQIAQQLRDGMAHGGGLPLGLSQGQGILRLHGQMGHLFGLVPHLSLGLGLLLGQTRLFHLPQGPTGVLQVGDGLELFQVHPAAVGVEDLQNLPLFGTSLGGGIGLLPVQAGAETATLLQVVPQAGGKHGHGGGVDGAEETLPHPQCQPQTLGIQHRLFVQKGADLFQLPAGLLFP